MRIVCVPICHDVRNPNSNKIKIKSKSESKSHLMKTQISKSNSYHNQTFPSQRARLPDVDDTWSVDRLLGAHNARQNLHEFDFVNVAKPQTETANQSQPKTDINPKPLHLLRFPISRYKWHFDFSIHLKGQRQHNRPWKPQHPYCWPLYSPTSAQTPVLISLWLWTQIVNKTKTPSTFKNKTKTPSRLKNDPNSTLLAPGSAQNQMTSGLDACRLRRCTTSPESQ